MKNKQFIRGIAVGVVIAIVFCAVASFGLSLTGVLNGNRADIYGKMNEIVNYLDDYYVDTISKSDLIEGIYTGLVNGVNDRYTVYMPEDVYNAFKEDMSGFYAGIGVYVAVDKRDGQIIVTSPISGSPGEKAGIRPRDKIIKVNGYEVNGEIMYEAISMMKGPENTTVSLTIYRESDDNTFDVDVVRAKINKPTVSYKMLEGNIGYIKITDFEQVTYEQFVQANNELNAAGQEALIIDVRNNPGGSFLVVCEICDILLPESTIVYTEDRNKNREYTKSDTKSLGKPIAVLVNEGSASASEILAGAIKDNNAGVLVGERTFGKGLVQRLFELSDGSAVKITIQKYFTPSGVCIQGIGIEPDYVVEMPLELKVDPFITEDEDIQLQKAISVLSNGD